jgi:hypothetical protein
MFIPRFLYIVKRSRQASYVLTLREYTHDVNKIPPSGAAAALEAGVERHTTIKAPSLGRDVEQKAPKIRIGIADTRF